MKKLKLLTASAVIMTMATSSVVPAFAYTKEETVYAKLKSDGSENKVVVSEHLINDDQEKELTDKSSLSDIVNMNGDEEYSQDGETIIWKTDGNDIYYQGNTKESLPVSMKLTYKLNGKEMKLKDMLGKKGKVEIQIKYENHEKKTVDGQELYVPFVVTTGTMLSTKTDSQVEVTNGKVISNGSHNIVVALATPGLSQNYDNNEELAKLNSVKIQYTTTKFKLNSIMSVATPSLLSEADLDFSQLDSLYNNIDQLTSSYNQIVSGGKQIQSGIQTVNQKMSDIINGTIQLQDGIKQVSNGTNQLTDGSTTLAEGIDQLNTGAKSLYSGVQALASQLPTLTEGVSQLEYASIVLNSAVTGGTYTDPATGQQYTINNDIVTNVNTLTTALSQINTMTSQFPDNQQIQALSAGLTELVTYLSTNEDGSQYLPYLQQVNTLLSSMSQLSSLDSQALRQAATDLTVSAQILTGLNSQLSGGVQALKEGATTLTQAVGRDASQEGTLLNGAAQVSNGLETVKEKVPAITKGFNQLSQGIDQLSKGADQLVNGTQTLKVEGMDQLESGANELVSGMIQFQDEGINKIADVLNNTVKKDVKKTEKLTQLSKDYKTMTGTNDDVEASTKFVMVIDGKSKKS